MGDPQSLRQLLKERKEQYGEAWKLSGQWMSIMTFEKPDIFNRILETPYFYNWTIILNKLARLLFTPSHIDSWKDIAGYAQLVVDDLEAANKTVMDLSRPLEATIIHQGVPRNETT